MNTKRCSRCGIEKSLNDFSVRKDSKSGYRAICKVCIFKRRRLYRENNKEIIQRRKHDYYIKNRKAIRERRRIFYQKNRDKIRKYKENHRKEIIKNMHIYRQTNHGKLIRRCCEAKRRARKKAVKSNLTLEEWNYILKSQGNKCNICHKRFNTKRPPQMDHIIPISAGGHFSSNNIQALCKHCNSSKYNNIDLSFIQTWAQKNERT